MNKYAKRIRSGAALYYGFSCLMAGVAGILGTGYWLYQVYSDKIEFTWGTLLSLIIIIVVVGLVGYALVRVGQEEAQQ